MEPREQRLIIILADISGYTKFMVENHLSAVHGQQAITFLIESLLREVDIPLELQEIEGDALFLYAARPDDEAAWQDVVTQVQTKLPRFFKVFIEAITGVKELTACKCAICAHADELKLKLIVHSGRAVFHTIGRLRQVSGADVILAHRLLKNSVPGHEYLLLSDAAYRELGQGMGIDFEDGHETYDIFGTVKTHVHFLDDETKRAREEFYARDPAGDKAAIRAYLRDGAFRFFPAALQQIRRPHSQAGVARRVLFVVSWLFYGPIFALTYPSVVAKRLEAKRASSARRASPSSCAGSPPPMARCAGAGLSPGDASIADGPYERASLSNQSRNVGACAK